MTEGISPLLALNLDDVRIEDNAELLVAGRNVTPPPSGGLEKVLPGPLTGPHPELDSGGGGASWSPRGLLGLSLHDADPRTPSTALSTLLPSSPDRVSLADRFAGHHALTSFFHTFKRTDACLAFFAEGFQSGIAVQLGRMRAALRSEIIR